MRYASRSRDLLASMALSIASVIIVLVLLEFGLRLIDGAGLSPGKNFLSNRIALLNVSVASQYDAELGWINIPNRTYIGDPSLTIGEHGVRVDPHFNVPASGGVLAVGDSLTVGSDVDDESAWPAQLAMALGRPIINAGVGGYAVDQVILRARRLVPIYSPSVIILQGTPDTIDRVGYATYGGGNKPYYRLENGAPVLHNSPVPLYSGSVGELGPLRSLLGRSYLVDWTMRRIGYTAWWQPPALGYVRVADTNEAMAISCRLLQGFKRDMDARGTRIILLMQYGGSEIEIWPGVPPYVTSVLSCARNGGIETVDLWAPLKTIADREPGALKSLYIMHGSDFGHLSRSGNAFVAAELKAALSHERAQ